MSLFHTAELNGVNPLDYLTELLWQGFAGTTADNTATTVQLGGNYRLLRWPFSTWRLRTAGCPVTSPVAAS